MSEDIKKLIELASQCKEVDLKATDIDQFIEEVGLERGEDNISIHLLHDYYKLWADESIGKMQFESYLNEFTIVGEWVKINESALKITKRDMFNRNYAHLHERQKKKRLAQKQRRSLAKKQI